MVSLLRLQWWVQYLFVQNRQNGCFLQKLNVTEMLQKDFMCVTELWYNICTNEYRYAQDVDVMTNIAKYLM